MFKGIPKIAWISAILALFVIIMYIAKNYVKGVRTIWSRIFGKKEEDLPPNTEGDIITAELTPNIIHSNIASDQYKAMDGIGTNNKLLFRPFREHNLSPSDCNLIFKHFKKKEGSTLTQWYASDLSGALLQEMRQHWQGTPHVF